MSKNYERREALSELEAQNNFYESSVEWVRSLKERHDPYDLIGIVDNDIERYPFLAVGQPIFQAVSPSERQILNDGLFALQQPILSEVRQHAGTGGLPESALKLIWHRLIVPRNNVSNVVLHPNIMAIPLYSAGITTAFSRADFLGDKFNLFEFREQNLMPVNAALAVASFMGRPVLEELSQFSTIIKTMPPTRSALQYGMDRRVQRKIVVAAKEALDLYLNELYAKKRSAYMTVDPTASTVDLITQDGKPVAMQRKPVNLDIQRMILSDFGFVWPMTMIMNGGGTKWYVGELKSLRGGSEYGSLFNDIIENLDRQTERLAGGLKMQVGQPERVIGKAAISQ
jgi:hypothetical protein